MWSEIAFWPLLWVWLVIVVRNALVFIHLNEPQWCSARCFGTRLAMNICEDAPSWPCKLLSQMPPTQCKKLWNRWHDMRLSRLGNPWEDKPWLWAVGLHRSIPDVNQAQALSIPEQFCPPHHHRCHHLPAYDVGSKKHTNATWRTKRFHTHQSAHPVLVISLISSTTCEANQSQFVWNTKRSRVHLSLPRALAYAVIGLMVVLRRVSLVQHNDNPYPEKPCDMRLSLQLRVATIWRSLHAQATVSPTFNGFDGFPATSQSQEVRCHGHFVNPVSLVRVRVFCLAMCHLKAFQWQDCDHTKVILRWLAHDMRLWAHCDFQCFCLRLWHSSPFLRTDKWNLKNQEKQEHAHVQHDIGPSTQHSVMIYILVWADCGSVLIRAVCAGTCRLRAIQKKTTTITEYNVRLNLHT
jgi:hypothetical protein